MAPRIQSSAVLELPKRIGRYEAFLQIGAGGMARVYLAAHRIQGVIELVVVKELRPAAVGDADALVMFKDEAQIAMRLSHPNVITTRDVVANSPDYYLVMEYLEGKSLLEVLQGIGRDRMPLEDHVWILTQVLAGLEHAHELR